MKGSERKRMVSLIEYFLYVLIFAAYVDFAVLSADKRDSAVQGMRLT